MPKMLREEYAYAPVRVQFIQSWPYLERKAGEVAELPGSAARVLIASGVAKLHVCESHPAVQRSEDNEVESGASRALLEPERGAQSGFNRVGSEGADNDAPEGSAQSQRVRAPGARETDPSLTETK